MVVETIRKNKRWVKQIWLKWFLKTIYDGVKVWCNSFSLKGTQSGLRQKCVSLKIIYFKTVANTLFRQKLTRNPRNARTAVRHHKVA